MTLDLKTEGRISLSLDYLLAQDVPAIEALSNEALYQQLKEAVVVYFYLLSSALETKFYIPTDSIQKQTTVLINRVTGQRLTMDPTNALIILQDLGRIERATPVEGSSRYRVILPWQRVP